MKRRRTTLAVSCACALSLLGVGAAHADLVSYYDMNGNLVDPISGNDGTYVGGTETYVEGWDGTPMGAVSFDGASYVRLAHTSGLPLRSASALTVSMWVKGAQQSDRRVFSEGSTASNTPLYNVGTANDGASGAVDVFIREDGGTRVNHLKVGTAFDDTWHHIAVVDDNGAVTIYVDAVEVGSTSYTRDVMTVNTTTLGGILRAAACCWFTGAIDDVRLYDHALTLTEILELVPVPGGCISRFGFDGDTLDAVSGNDGTFVGGEPVFVEGHDGTPGSALSFDGVDDYVNVAQNVGLPLTDNPSLSVTMWVRGAAQQDRRVFSEGSTTSNTPLYNIGTDNRAIATNTGALDFFVRRDDNATVVGHHKTDRAAYDATWHHIAVVDDNGAVTFYIDGVEEGPGVGYLREPLTTNTTTVGGILRAASCCWFAGAIDEVHFYTRAIPAEEVAYLAGEADGCPAEGDTTCTMVTAAGPDGGVGPGEWTFTVEDAADAGADDVLYRFVATNSASGERMHAGPQASNVGTFTFLEGAWTVTAIVDDDILCRDPEGTCSTDIAVIPNERVIADLPLDGDLVDATGNAHDGTFVGEAATPFTTGYDCADPGAVSFDGVDDFINLATSDDLPIYNNVRYSVALWVRGVPTPAMRDRRVYSEGSSTSNNPLFNIGTDNVDPPSGAVDIFIRNDSGTQLVPHLKSQGTAFDGEWHHIAWVDDFGAAKLYIDGVEDATDFTYTKENLTIDTATVGGILRAASCCWFPGDIDDVVIVNYALTPEEITALYGAGPSLCGPSQLAADCNQDGSRDISDVICYVFGLFPGFVLVGGSPGLPCGGDLQGPSNLSILNINEDGQVDVSDVVYLCNYLFRGGNPPVQGEGCVMSGDRCEGNAACLQ